MKALYYLFLFLIPLSTFSQAQNDSLLIDEWGNMLYGYQSLIDSALKEIDNGSTETEIEAITAQMRSKSWELEKFYRKNIKDRCSSSADFYLPMSSALAQSNPALSSFYLMMFFIEDDDCDKEDSIQRKFERIAHLSWRIKHSNKEDKSEKFQEEICQLNNKLAYQ